MEIAFVLGLLAIAIALFASEAVPVDVTTLLLLLALIVGGTLTPREAFAGFASELILTLIAIFVLSGALQQTGAVSNLAERLERWAAGSETRLMALLLAAVGTLSSVINNTTATAVFLPPTVQAARRMRLSPSRLLMPLAYVSILGGTCTLIGTSTNLAVSGFLETSGERPLGLFELTPVGLAVLPLGVAYLLLVSRRLIPTPDAESLAETYELREYLSEVVVPEDSGLVGQRVFDSDFSHLDLRVLEIHRGDSVFQPGRNSTFAAGDLVLVQGPAERLIRVQRTAGLDIHGDLLLGDAELKAGDLRIAEAIVPNASALVGKTLKSVRFRQRFGAAVLALHRGGHPLRPDRLGRLRLKVGDLLLVQGPSERLEQLRRNRDLWVIDNPDPLSVPRPWRGYLTAAALLVAVGVGGLGWLPLSVAFLSAALLAVLVRAITMEEAYRFIEWRLIVLIGGMTAFGTAMESSGAAAWVADGMVGALQGWGPHAVLAGFVLVTIALTQPMSNAAAALVLLPVALSSAASLGVSDRPFVIAITLAASLSFITPLEPSCLLVYGPGRYRFRDFTIVGGPLTLMLMGVVLVMVPWLWPF
jgi:di/tricarboxylate transporter